MSYPGSEAGLGRARRRRIRSTCRRHQCGQHNAIGCSGSEDRPSMAEVGRERLRPLQVQNAGGIFPVQPWLTARGVGAGCWPAVRNGGF